MSAKDVAVEHHALDAAITHVLDHMSEVKCESEEYAKLVDHLAKLYKMKEIDAAVRAEVENSRRVSPDTMAIVGANLLGILMIIGHERANVIATKALGLLTKLR